MNTLEAIKQLKEKFGAGILEELDFFDQKTLEVTKEKLKEILAHLKQSGFLVLTDLTGVDHLFPDMHTHVIYWLQNPSNYQRIRIITSVKREEELPSVIDLWEGANWYERELFDLFGVWFYDHPDLTRILMPDDWIGHPLRRDYPLTEEPVQFKHGVKPKVPSEIIPYVKTIQKF